MPATDIYNKQWSNEFVASPGERGKAMSLFQCSQCGCAEDHIGLYRRLRETPRADERRKILKLLAQKRAEFKLELQNVDLVRSRMECRPE
jgi:hypothetical protein